MRAPIFNLTESLGLGAMYQQLADHVYWKKLDENTEEWLLVFVYFRCIKYWAVAWH